MQAIVVGGGIIGLSSAYYLQNRDIDVTLLEKSDIGAGNTVRSNGGIRAQFSSPVSAALSKASIKVWERLDEEFGVDIDYRRPGYLFLARAESTAEQFRENVRTQNNLGVDSEFLAPEEAAEHCPGLRTDEYRGGAYCSTDGFADPERGLHAFARAANEAGADIRTGVEVTDVLQNNADEVVGVETSDGTINGDFVVNAAGSWGGEVARMAGVDIPLSPKRRQLVIVEPEVPVEPTVPFTIDADRGAHFRPEQDGRAIVGGHFGGDDPFVSPDDLDDEMDVQWASDALREASNCVDYFGSDSEVVRGWAGLYAMTPDHHPVLEESKPGFVNAVGFSGHGFMQAPATGQIVAELVADGEVSLVDTSSLTATRFEKDIHLEEGTVIN